MTKAVEVSVYDYRNSKKRMKVLVHWEKHGLESTDAFGILRRTLFNGSELLNKAVVENEALNPKKRTPKNKRRRSGIGEFGGD